MPSVAAQFSLRIQRLENGALKYGYEGTLTPAEITWVLDEMKMKLHRESAVPTLPGLPNVEARRIG